MYGFHRASLVTQLVKNLSAIQETQVQSLAGEDTPGKIPQRRIWKPTPVFLPGEFHGQRRLVGYIVHGVTNGQT